MPRKWLVHVFIGAIPLPPSPRPSEFKTNFGVSGSLKIPSHLHARALAVFTLWLNGAQVSQPISESAVVNFSASFLAVVMH